jgi:hypothetical protein
MSATVPLARAILDALDSDPEARDQLADLLVPHVWKRMEAPAHEQPQDGWLDTRRAAEYLGVTTSGLHKLTAGRLIPFEQDGPGCRCWFKRSELDTWRENGGTRAIRRLDNRNPRIRSG